MEAARRTSDVPNPHGDLMQAGETRARERSTLSGVLLLGFLLGVPAHAQPLEPGALAAAARRAGVEVGAAVDTDLDVATFALTAREFTSVTTENALKWRPLAPTSTGYDFARADGLVAWAEQNGLRIRGHTLFWDRLNGRPVWLAGELAGVPDPAAHLTQRMEDHARTVVGRYRGRIADWDVVNEPLALGGNELDPQNLYVQTLGEGYLDVAFHAARAADPEARLFLNEVLTEAPRVFEGLLALLERLLARGVPVDGVGLQSHFFLGPPDPIALRGQLERIAALGLDVELTELDLPLFLFSGSSDPLAAQAQSYADLFSACLAVPACTGITTWGVHDGHTWLDSPSQPTSVFAPNRPLLFDALGEPKPAYATTVAVLRAASRSVEIAIRPGEGAAAVRPGSRGVIPVAVLGSASFDVHAIDPTTLAFGPAGAAPAHRAGGHLADVNADGRTDLLSHYRSDETGVARGDLGACLSGETFDGVRFEGCG